MCCQYFFYCCTNSEVRTELQIEIINVLDKSRISKISKIEFELQFYRNIIKLPASVNNQINISKMQLNFKQTFSSFPMLIFGRDCLAR